VGNRTLLGFGGTFSIESPAPYSAVAKGLIEELGIDVPSYSKYVDKGLYRSLGLAPKIFFDKETFGADRLVINPAPLGGSETGDQSTSLGDAWKVFMADAPLSEKGRNDFLRLHERKGLPLRAQSDEKKAKLARTSYAEVLTDLAGADPDVVRFYQPAPTIVWRWHRRGFGAGRLGWASWLDGMNLDPAAGKGMNAMRFEARRRTIFLPLS